MKRWTHWYRRIVLALRILKQFEETKDSIESALADIRLLTQPGSRLRAKADTAAQNFGELVRLLEKL